MNESVDLEQTIDKARFEEEYLKLRTELLDAQFDLIESKQFPVILVVAGMEGTGVVDALTSAHKVLDARHVVTFALDTPTQEEAERPRMWRFWRVLPPKGEIGIYAGSWYSTPLTDRVLGKTNAGRFDQQLDAIKRFETMLAAEGALILKFWLHLSKKDQKKRLKKLEKSERTKWRIEESPWGGNKRYSDVKTADEQMMRATGTEQAPWIPVNAVDNQNRTLRVGNTILNAIRSRLEQAQGSGAPPATEAAAPVSTPDHGQQTCLKTLDLSLKLEKEDNKKQLAHYQNHLNELLRSRKFRKRSLVLVFEGNDAAGKGGSIRRVIEFIDPRRYRINQFAAPTDEEKAQPYLWRFWRRLPRRNHIAIFDRSWYGRVLVERVEGFCAEADWRRAYDEINDFEKQMADAGSIIIKFWLAIDKDEQERRFRAREVTGYKRYKIT